MRQEFIDIVRKLKTDQYAAISVYDEKIKKKILLPTTSTELISKYGSIENYFEKLKNDGVTLFSILEFKKNGSGFKNMQNSILNLHFGEKTEENMIYPAQPIISQNVASLTGGLHGQVVGLGFMEVANLMSDSRENVKLSEENKYLKTQNEELKKQVDELKEERLITKYDSSKSSATNELLLGLAQNLPSILSGLKGSAAPADGASLTGVPTVTETKAEFINYISSPAVSDDMIHFLFQISETIKKDSSKFEEINTILS
jgi:hypothetical protein